MKTKEIKEIKEKEVTNKVLAEYTFPEHGVTVTASSLKEANKLLDELKGGDK